MIVTLIKHTDGTRSVLYGRQELAIGNGIAENPKHINIGQELVEKIKVASTSQVQEILSKLY